MLRTYAALTLAAVALAPAAASADPLPDPPPIHGYCEVYWLQVPVTVAGQTVLVPIPRMAC